MYYTHTCKYAHPPSHMDTNTPTHSCRMHTHTHTDIGYTHTEFMLAHVFHHGSNKSLRGSHTEHNVYGGDMVVSELETVCNLCVCLVEGGVIIFMIIAIRMIIQLLTSSLIAFLAATSQRPW